MIKRKMAKRWEEEEEKQTKTKKQRTSTIKQGEKTRVVDDEVEKEDIFTDKKKTRERKKNKGSTRQRIRHCK